MCAGFVLGGLVGGPSDGAPNHRDIDWTLELPSESHRLTKSNEAVAGDGGMQSVRFQVAIGESGPSWSSKMGRNRLGAIWPGVVENGPARHDRGRGLGERVCNSGGAGSHPPPSICPISPAMPAATKFPVAASAIDRIDSRVLRTLGWSGLPLRISLSSKAIGSAIAVR